MPTDAQRAGDFTALSTRLEESGESDHERPVHRQLGSALRRREHHQRRLHQPGGERPARQYVPTSPSGTVVTLSPAPRDHAVYMARGDYHFSGRNQLNAHFFADRSDSSSWPGNVNYVQQTVFSDVNQFGVSDAHIFSPRLVNEVTFSYLTSRSGGGARHADRPAGSGRQRRCRKRRTRHELLGVRIHQPGVPGRERAGLLQLAGEGHDDLQRRQPHAEVGVRVHQARLRVQPGAHALGELHRDADGQRHRGLHDRGVRQLDDRVRDCRPQPVHGEAPGVHRRLVQDASEVHAELRPAVRAVHPVRPEGRPPHHLGAGRAVDGRARRAERHSVPGRSGTAVAAHEQRSEQFRAAARRGVGRDRRCEDGRPRRVRHLLPADQRRDHARGRGTVARDHAASAGADRRSVRFARADGAAAGIAGPVRLLADLAVPGPELHAVSGADPHRLHRPGPEDQLHAPLQRVAPAPARREPRGGGGLRRQDRQQAGRPQLLQRGAVHQLADHRTAADAAERRAAGAVQPGHHQRAVARARQLLPKRRITACSCGSNAALPGASRSPAPTRCRRT